MGHHLNATLYAYMTDKTIVFIMKARRSCRMWPSRRRRCYRKRETKQGTYRAIRYVTELLWCIWRYSIPNALVYHCKYVSEILWKKMKFLISFSKHDKMITWYPNYIFFTNIIFLTILVAMATIEKGFCYDIWRKQNLCIIAQNITDIITIFSKE